MVLTFDRSRSDYIAFSGPIRFFKSSLPSTLRILNSKFCDDRKSGWALKETSTAKPHRLEHSGILITSCHGIQLKSVTHVMQFRNFSSMNEKREHMSSKDVTSVRIYWSLSTYTCTAYDQHISYLQSISQELKAMTALRMSQGTDVLINSFPGGSESSLNKSSQLTSATYVPTANNNSRSRRQASRAAATMYADQGEFGQSSPQLQPPTMTRVSPSPPPASIQSTRAEKQPAHSLTVQVSSSALLLLG